MCFGVRFNKLMRRHRHDLTLVLQSIKNRLPWRVHQCQRVFVNAKTDTALKGSIDNQLEVSRNIQNPNTPDSYLSACLLSLSAWGLLLY